MLRSGRKQLDDVLNGLVGLVIRSFELTVGAMRRIGAMMEAAVGQWAAEALVKEQEQKRDLAPFAVSR